MNLKKNKRTTDVSGAEALLLRFDEEVQKHGVSSKTIRLFQKIIYKNFKEQGRNLPWRFTDNPYYILISEVMLQQTQVARVIRKYKEFIRIFPDILSLSRASLRKILTIWQGLGYNRRALSLKKTAKIIIKKFKGMIPSTIEDLASLPGIGKTTASEIAAFAFNKPAVILETNIRTVFIHFFYRDKNRIEDSQILPLVERTFDASTPRLWYYALMDYGVMLKKEYPNPGRKSAHYQKQTPFKNSDREVRGLILKILIKKPHLSKTEIAKMIQTDSVKTNRIILELQKDGLITKKGRAISIT